MIELPNPGRASKWCAERRARGLRLGYVPTMGALHAGHLSLVERAVRENHAACASIFVNPLQFNDRADLRDYPRDWQRDTALLDRVGCAMVFTGELDDFFPGAGDAGAPDTAAAIDPGPGARGLEGDFRPGHLQGVCRIVDRLFATVGPCCAYFGEKDFQQTLVVAAVARRIKGLEVRVCPTVREASGLALSSRNRRLDAAHLEVAAQLYQALLAARAAWQAGARDPADIESAMCTRLQDPRITLDYAAVRDPCNWSEHPPPGPLQHARALVAATVGGVRLIDNLQLD